MANFNDAKLQLLLHQPNICWLKKKLITITAFTVMLYSIALISTKHQHEAAIGLSTSPPTEHPSHFPPHPISLGCSQALNLSSLNYTANFHWLSNFTYGNILVLMVLSQFIPSFLTPMSTNLLSMCFHCCPTVKFISIIFLGYI